MEYPFKDLLPLDEVLEREGYYKDWTHLDPEVFYSLTQISEYIKTKGYGVDVRLLIAQLAEHFGLKSTQIIDLANLLQQQFDTLEGVTQSFTNNINSLVAQMEEDKNAVIANATVDSEVILARGGKATLGQRLDDADAQLAQIVDERLQFVTYDMFKDDMLSDEEVIKQAHLFANENNLPVKNTRGVYHIESLREIPIKTSTDWGNTEIHINEEFSTKRGVFIVENEEERYTLPPNALPSLSLRKGQKVIPELAPYEHCFIVIVYNTYVVRSSTDDRVYDRDFFYVTNGGKIIGDITQNSASITAIHVHPVSGKKITIKGGVFHLSGETSKIEPAGYIRSGIEIRRSNVTITNQEVRFDEDVSSNNRSGFYYISNCYNVEIDGVGVPPVNTTPGGYGIGGDNVLNLSLNNIRGEGHEKWGLIGTNFIRNLYVNNCNVNRIDIHYGGWNVYINNSNIGNRGIHLQGGGDLFITNTLVNSATFIVFRGDYGSTWDGDVRISNGTLKPYNGEDSIYSIIGHGFDYNHIYNKELIFTRSVSIQDFTFDFSELTGDNVNKNAYILIYPNGKSLDGLIHFPTNIDVRNVTKSGRKKGLHLMRLFHPRNYYMEEEGKFDFISKEIECNSFIRFDNIETVKKPIDPTSSDAHLFITNLSSDDMNALPNQLIPKIVISNCENLSLNIQSMIGKLIVEDSSLSGLNAATSGGSRHLTVCDFRNLDIKANIQSDYASSIGFRMGGATSNSIRHYQTFTNCLFYPVKVNGVIDIELTKTYYDNVLNFETENISFNHINTRASSLIHTEIHPSSDLLNKMVLSNTRI